MWGTSRIAFVSNRTGRYQIYMMRPDGSGVTQLTDSAGDNRSPAWSQDAKHVFFVSTRDGNSEIYVMNPDGTGQTRITSDPGSDWMPLALSSQRVAFVSDRGGYQHIVIMNADGTGITEYPQTRLDTSSKLVCMTWFGFEGTAQFFYTIEKNGSRVTRILDFSNGDTWIPEPLARRQDRSCPFIAQGSNSVWTIIQTNRDGHDEIYGFTDSDQSDEQFTKGAEPSQGVARSGDGGWITYYTTRNGSADIYVMYLRSKEQWNITNDPSDDVDPAWEPY